METGQKKCTEQLKVIDKADKFTDWMYSEVKPFLKGDILEVGSGIGTYSNKIARDFKHNNKFFTDFNLEYVEKLRELFKDDSSILATNLDLLKPENPQIKIGSFDSIIALNVIEHIEDDITALNNIYDFLKPGGVFVMLVPAHKWLFNCMDEAAGHYRRYSQSLIKEKISTTNFKLKKIYYFNFLSICGWYINGKVFKKQIANENAVRFLNKIIPFLSFLERYILNKKIGISIIAIMEK